MIDVMGGYVVVDTT